MNKRNSQLILWGAIGLGLVVSLTVLRNVVQRNAQSAQPSPGEVHAKAHAEQESSSADEAGATAVATGLAGTAPTFGLHGPVRLTDVPSGRLRDELLTLAPVVRADALKKLGDLRVPRMDVASLRVDPRGRLYYECAPPDPEMVEEHRLVEEALSALPAARPAAAAVPISTPPVLHSKPGSTKVIYLDFNGHTITGTGWNATSSVSIYVAKPFDADSNPGTFSDSEQATIISIWQRVAEDFKPFDVDVTTEEPAVFTNTTGRILITESQATDGSGNSVNMPSYVASGVAYLGVFGDSDYVSYSSPALVYADRLYYRDDYIAETASHEIGHNLSLSHDGTDDGTNPQEYYGGHGDYYYYSETSWGPIMGGPFGRQMTQWSKGEYLHANNTQDDLAIIAGHLGYIPLDDNDTNASAIAMTVAGENLSAQGIIGAAGDADRFAFTVGLSAVSFTVNPLRSSSFTNGGNLDVRLQLYNAANQLLADNDLANIFSTQGTLTVGLTAGTYYLRVSGSGMGEPLAAAPYGYTAYGSQGQFTVLGTVSTPVAPTMANQPNSRTVTAGQTQVDFYVGVNGSPLPTYQWQRLPAGGSTWSDLADGTDYSGATTNYLTVLLATTAMNGDQFRCVATNVAGSVTSNPATLTVNPAVAPGIYNLPASQAVNYGESLNLYPTITGTQPMTYVWKKDGVAIPDATGSYYYKSGMTTADSGSYTLSVTNYAGTTTSNSVVVTVNPAVAPVIYNLPSSTTVNYGESWYLSPSISGTYPMTYQWKKDGVDIPGATNGTYYKGGMTTADSGVYTLTATNVAGSATSTGVTVTVNAAVAPTIYNLQPTVIVNYGESLSLSPSISGSQPMTFEWKKDGVAIPNATSSSYYKNAMTTADSGVYTLTATNVAGSVTSVNVTVTVNDAVPPIIYNLPQSVTVNHGDTLNLYPSISGTQPRTYVWKKDGVTIVNATSSSYYKYGVTAADSGVYTLTVSNVAGSATSANVTVTVNAPVAPVIYNLPPSVTVNYGDSLSLSPSITGTQPMSFVWKKDGAAIPNATYSSYYRSGMTTADSGVYTLTATNLVGSTTSANVTVTVNTAVAPSIFNLPSTLSVNYGESIGLSPSITGTQPMTFAWKKDGVAIPNATSSSYYKSGATTAESGVYTLTATNLAGSTTSANVTVTVNAAVAPAIFNLPSTVIVNYGESMGLYPSITGTQPMTYLWKKDGVAIPNATGSSYYKSGMTTAESGVYTLTATNLAGSTTSANVTVTVNAAVAPVIYNLPATMNVNYGETLSIYPSITGTQPMTYQWKKGGVDIAGATGSSYYKNGTTTADSGIYTLTATNLVGATTSANVTVTINAAVAPTIANLPATVTVNYGESLNLYPSVSGTAPMTFQWKKDGVDIPGATNSSYYRSGMTTAESGVYTLTATNLVGPTTSTNVTVTVNAAVAPAISHYQATMTLSYGYSLSLYPSITGTYPMTYQWKKDGVEIPGATSSSYYKSSATPADSGLYTLTATNLAGATTSTGVTVTVDPAVLPNITQQPSSTTVFPGRTARLSVVVTGTSPFTYQWYHDSQALPGGVYAELQLNNVQESTAGTYTVQITNAAGTVTSNGATVSLAAAKPVVFAAAGPNHSLFIQSDGTLWGMGDNGYGRLGVGDTQSRIDPVKIADGVVAAAAGGNHSLFIKADGTLWAMGNNYYGQLGDGSTTNRITPVQVAAGVVAVSASWEHSLFIKSDGTLWAMGNNGGRLGNGFSSSSSTPVKVASMVASASAGWEHSLFVKADGTLWGTGSNDTGQLGDGTTTRRYSPVQVAADVVTASAAGGNYSHFIKTDGTLWATGYNYNGQLGDATIVSKSTPVQVTTAASSVSDGGSYSLLLKTDQTLWSTGYNGSGQLGNGTYNSTITYAQVASGVSQIVAGAGHGFYLDMLGSLWGMGGNYSGQLGLGGSPSTQSTPALITGGVLQPPSAPAALSATDGSLARSIRLNWSPAYGATSYEVWRGTSEDALAAVRIAQNIQHPLFFDLSVTADTSYRYWVKAVNPAGSSTLSSSDVGYAVQSIKAISFGTITLPESVPAGWVFGFSCRVTNEGSDAWGSNHQLSLRDAAGNYVSSSGLMGVAPGASKHVDVSFVVPEQAGTYTYYLQAKEDETGLFGPVVPLTLKIVYSGQNGLAAKIFERVNGRTPTLAEVQPYGNTLSGGGSLASIFTEMLAGSEYAARQKERAIRLYYATFNRMPDEVGLYYWASVLAGGAMSPTEVATAFAQSQEFLDTYGNLGNEAYVTQLYRNTLGRDPDAAGLAYWVGQMNAGLTRGQLLLAFADSQEFADRMEPEVEVVRLYHLLLGRMPTSTELSNWRGFLRGYDQTETILSSTEFTTLHPGGLSQAEFVDAIFQGFLLRTVDPGSRSYYSGLLTGGSLARPELIHQIMDSGEFRTTVVPVTRHYLAVFLRAPDLVGSTHWTNLMRAGLGFTQLSQVFADSAEFASSYAGLTDTQFVSQMYLNILGRPADTGGLNHWVNLFATGQSDEAGLLLSFVLSWEAGWRFAPDIRTIGHYQAFYGRSPTNTELTFWKDYLTSLPTQFRQEILQSVEFNSSP